MIVNGTRLYIAGCIVAAGMAGQTPAPPDIAGFHLGIPLNEAVAGLKSYNRHAAVSIGDIVAPEIDRRPIAYGLTLAENQESSAEIVEIDVTLPPEKQVVWRIVRKQLFPTADSPLISNLMAGLRRRYGKESFAETGAPLDVAWYFDEQGRPASPVKSPRACSDFDGSPDVNLAIVRGEGRALPGLFLRPRDVAEPCRALVILHARIEAAPDSPSAESLTLSLSDYSLEQRSNAAAVALSPRSARAWQPLEFDKVTLPGAAPDWQGLEFVH